MASRFYKFMNCLEKQVAKSLTEAGIITRPVKGNGLWCHVLLPAVLVLQCLRHDMSRVYRMTTFVSVGMVCYSILFTIFTSVSSLVLREELYGGSIVSSMISALLIYCYIDYGIITSYILTLPTVWLYSSLLRYILTVCPKTFTFGEAMIFVQATLLTLFMLLAKLVIEEKGEFDLVNSTIFIFLISICTMIVILNKMQESKRTFRNLCYVVVGGATLCLTLLHHALGRDVLPKLVNFVFFHDDLRAKILLLWLTLLGCAVFIIFLNTSSGQKADSVTRKSFHILGSFVFILGILFDIELIRLAAGLAFGLLIFVEALRLLKIETVSPILQSSFVVYCDEKDVGTFAMTPIYLFLGIACPLIITPVFDEDKLVLLSGVLSIGIGDTAASWFGSRYGVHYWNGSLRTMEGTIFNILSQVITVYGLHSLDIVTGSRVMVRAVISSVISSMVEANTDQVDNLILPLITIICYQVTNIIS